MDTITVMSDTNNGKEARPPNARLCHVIKSDNFDGYGFNLHAEKGKPGQYIGKVDEGSPAETAGLRQGDRILEVNGVSIRNENHKQVVQRIKALPNETKLLVVDPNEEVQNNSMDNGNGTTVTTATANAQGNGHTGHHEENNSTSLAMQQTQNQTNNNAAAGLNLSMTAAELRAKLAAKKKFDPRKESIDFKKKFDAVQKL